MLSFSLGQHEQRFCDPLCYCSCCCGFNVVLKRLSDYCRFCFSRICRSRPCCAIFPPRFRRSIWDCCVWNIGRLGWGDVFGWAKRLVQDVWVGQSQRCLLKPVETCSETWSLCFAASSPIPRPHQDGSAFREAQRFVGADCVTAERWILSLYVCP